MSNTDVLDYIELLKVLKTEGKLLLNAYQLGVKEAEESNNNKAS